MNQYNEKHSEIVIRNAEDVWNAMFNYELDDVFGDVLDYFLRETSLKNREAFVNLCQALDQDHLDDILGYFLNHYNIVKLLMLFEGLDVDQQAYFMGKLVHNVCDDNKYAQEKSIIQFRKMICSWRLGAPDDVKSAIHEAEQNVFSNLIQFFRKHPKKMTKFIDQLKTKQPERSDEILGGVLLELFSKLPVQMDSPDDFESLAA